MRLHPPAVLLGLSLLAAMPAGAQPALGVSSRLTAGVQQGEPLLEIDSLFYVANRGLTRIGVRLNEHRFTLTADPAEAAQGASAFLIPREGTITIHIGDLLVPDDDDPFDDTCEGFPDGPWTGYGNNCIAFFPQGPDGADAQIVISDALLEGEAVAYAIRRDDLQPIPDRLALLSSHPNPFRDATTITFTIPEDRSTGLPVHLAVYDARGRLVRVLVDGRRYPGTFTVVWDGRTGSGAEAASGLYLARLLAGDARRTIRLTRIR